MKKGNVVVLVVLTALTLVSLVLDGIVIYGLAQARRIALEAVGNARAVLDGIGDDTFSYALKVDQEIPISASVPFNQEVRVPIQTTLPISTVVEVPIDAGLLGTFDVEVPVRAVVPVNLEVAIPVSKTVDIATTVFLNTSVPIEIPIADTPLHSYLEQIDTALESAEVRLRHPEIW